MPVDFIKRLLQKTSHPDLVQVLTKELTGSELNSLLLEVFDQRVSAMDASQLLNLYQQNRFTKPADLPVLELKKMELDLLTLFDRYQFQLLELSPVAQLGSCSVVAPTDQKKIVSALRGTEVLADATNAIALHVSDIKSRGVLTTSDKHKTLNFATVQRHVRAQTIKGAGMTPHFKIACLVSCGIDRGNYSFERESLRNHLVTMTDLYRNYYKVDDISFRFLTRKGYANSLDLARRVREFIVNDRQDIHIEILEQEETGNAYYKGIQYKIDIRVKDKTYEIGDGGFVDWTQQLLQNKKERMLSTGIGFEFMYRIMMGHV